MKTHTVLDVSSWSRFETQRRHPLWWGIAGLIVIEVTVVVAFFASYFFLGVSRGTPPGLEHLDAAWPPPGTEPLPLFYPTVNLLLLGLCSATMYYGGRVMREEKLRQLVAMFVICSAAGVLVLYFRWKQFQLFDFKWNENAYGSMVWALTGFHFAHVLSAVLGTAAIGLLAAKGYYGRKRKLAVDVDTLYWYFVSFAWLAIYLVLYWEPRLL